MQNIDALYAALRDEIAGPRALDTATTIARYNRITGSQDFAAVVDVLATQLRNDGADSVTIERFPIDGVQRYMGRVFGPAHEPHHAQLRVLSPKPYIICDYDETPMCLPSGTPATSPDGIIAQVIDVGRGDRAEDYTGLDVAGKAVMATGLTTDVYNLAVEQHGAICVMTTNMYEWSNLPERKRSMVDLPDATHLARLYYDADKRRDAPAFSITYRHSQRLRALLDEGPVTIHAIVQAENKPGDLLVVDATIQGSDLAADEVWILAHLCHPKPGACDNGSGVAAGVEIFRAVAALLRTGTLPRPRRTLRLLLLPEVSGTQAYLDRYEARINKVVAAINLDMVGASTIMTGAYCRLVQTPWSRPSFLNHLGGYLLEKASLGSTSHIRAEPVRDWLYALAPYDKGSDHDVLLNSAFAIPSVFFFYWPHRYYHTDHDTPEKLDPHEFARTGAVAGAMALVTATLNAELAGELLALVQTEAIQGLTRQALKHQGFTPRVHGSDTDALPTSSTAHIVRLTAQAEMELGALRSVVNTLPAHERSILTHQLTQATTTLGPWLARDGSADADPKYSLVPVRVEAWPVNLGNVDRATGDARLTALRAAGDYFDDKAIAALNYADGRRTVGQIARLVTGELGEFAADQAAAWFEILAESHVVTWGEQ